MPWSALSRDSHTDCYRTDHRGGQGYQVGGLWSSPGSKITVAGTSAITEEKDREGKFKSYFGGELTCFKD